MSFENTSQPLSSIQREKNLRLNGAGSNYSPSVANPLLKGALDWARRGFPVLPLWWPKEDGTCACGADCGKNARKHPLGALVPNGVYNATQDENIISKWWELYPDANIGIAMGNGFLAVDIDVKNGANGLDTFLNLNLFFDTLTHRTPSGGFHAIYKTPEDFRNQVHDPRLPGIDIRSLGTCIVAPPSRTAEGPYSVDMSCSPGPLPTILKSILQPPAGAQSNEVFANLDGKASIHQFTQIAKTYPPSVQGRGGNNNLFALAAMACRDYAISPETTIEILYEQFNPRCVPPWGEYECGNFERTIRNGAEYGRSAIGEKSPERLLESIRWPVEALPACPQTGGDASAAALPATAPACRQGGPATAGGAAPVDDEDEAAPDDYDENNFFDFIERVDIHEVSGILAALRDWVVKMSPIYRNGNMALAPAVAVLSTLAGRHLASPTGCTLNLFMTIIAKTGVGKDWPLKAASFVLAALGHDYLTTGSFASAAALEAHLEKNPCALARIDEIGNQLLARITNRKATSHEQALGATVRELWSSGFGDYVGISAVSRGGGKRISRAHFGIIGAATEAEFYQALGSGNVDNGLFNRLTIIPAGPSEAHEDDVGPGELPPTELLAQLRAILPPGQEGLLQFRSPKLVEPPLTIPWADTAAKSSYLDFRNELDRRGSEAPALQVYTRRTAEQAVRLATLHALGREGRNATVTVEDMRWGISFSVQSAETAIRGAKVHIADNEQQSKFRLVQNNLEAIWKRKAVATRTDLYRRLDGRLKPMEIDQITVMLDEQRFMVLKVIEPSQQGGRPKITYTKRLKKAA